MCRLLYIKSGSEIDIQAHLQQFSLIARKSREYQGHGWGCAYLQNDEWQLYKNICPIWEDDLSCFGQSRVLIAHARSAFRDEDIIIDNNMPFQKMEWMYIFNGELHGVRIRERGRSGAAKIFNFIMRFHKGDMEKAISKGMGIIQKRSRYIRATNLIIANKTGAWVYSLFNQDTDYFTMHYKKYDEKIIVCSEPFRDQKNWVKINNHSLEVY